VKQYTYFPGCSSNSTAKALGMSVNAIEKPLDIELIELEDWTCCGSTPYGSLDEDESLLIAARNLALAEKKGLDLVTPCSSCFVVLNKANLHLKEHEKSYYFDNKIFNNLKNEIIKRDIEPQVFDISETNQKKTVKKINENFIIN